MKALIAYTLLKNKIIPSTESKKAVVIVIDNLKYDQWKQIEPLFLESFTKKKVLYFQYCNCNQYARNSFSLDCCPLKCKKFPNLWKNEEDEGEKTCMKRFLEAN